MVCLVQGVLFLLVCLPFVVNGCVSLFFGRGMCRVCWFVWFCLLNRVFVCFCGGCLFVCSCWFVCVVLYVSFVFPCVLLLGVLVCLLVCLLVVDVVSCVLCF